MDMIKRLVETSAAARSDVSTDDGGARSGSGRGKVVLTKFVEGDDVSVSNYVRTPHDGAPSGQNPLGSPFSPSAGGSGTTGLCRTT